jgi:hypothetical protein
MPKYDSPIGSRQIQGPPMREVSVSDESGFTPPPPQHRHMREEVPPFDPEAMRQFESEMQPRPQPISMKELSDVERQVFEAKKAQREGKQRLSDGARRRIEMLIGMTRLTRDIDIEGNMYRIQTLTSRELRDAITATAEFDGSVQFIFENRKQLLARSLVVVAGVEVQQFLNSNDLGDRIDFIEMMDHALLLRLFHEYNLLAKEAQDKYAVKTEAEVKGVLEDLKKP